MGLFCSDVLIVKKIRPPDEGKIPLITLKKWFPDSVGSNDRGNFSSLNGKVDFIDGNQAAKSFFEFFGSQKQRQASPIAGTRCRRQGYPAAEPASLL